MGFFNIFGSKPAHKSSPPAPRAYASKYPVPQGAPAADSYAYSGLKLDYFEKLLTGCFPQYSVCRNYPMSNAEAGSVPVSFLLCCGDAPVLAVILCSSREYDSPRITNTMDACQAKGIQVQRYFNEFRNEAGYVYNRVKEALYSAPAVRMPAPAAVPVTPAPAPAPVPKAGTWTCKCGSVNDSRFCPHCGTPLAWKCGCGRSNDGRFCPDCGTRNPNIRFN